MNVGKTLFAQIMEFVPWTSFARIVHRYGGNAGVAKRKGENVAVDPKQQHCRTRSICKIRYDAARSLVKH